MAVSILDSMLIHMLTNILTRTITRTFTTPEISSNLAPPPNYLTVADLLARYAKPPCPNIDDLFRMFGRRSATTTPTTPAASEHPPIRHRGRCLAKKGDGSTKPPKHLPKHLTKQQKNQKIKNPFPLLTRTPLQQILYKSVLPLQRSRSMSCSMAAPH